MKKLRIVSYAINGRGMGHLVRQLAILRWVRRIGSVLDIRCECWVLTSSEADTLARREGICAFKMPSKAMVRDAGIDPARYLALARSWTLNTIAGLQPDLLLVDTFPGGSFGELIAPLEMVPKRVLIARRVRESVAENPAYAALLPLYHKHITPDARDVGPILIRDRSELLPRQEARRRLGVDGDEPLIYVTFGGGGDVAAARALPQMVDSLVEAGHRVVVGGGPLYAGPELRGPRITWIDRYVPVELFSGIDAAVSAGGYNAYHELMHAGVPTVFTPQPRISDDQRERTERAVSAGAGVLAESLGEVPERMNELLSRAGDARAAALAMVPTNGALAAALASLSTVIAEADLKFAERVLAPSLWPRLFRGATAGQPNLALEVIRLLAGGSPREMDRRRAILAELADRGIDTSAAEGDDKGGVERVESFLAAADKGGLPLDTAVTLLKALRRTFPAASSAELGDAVVSLIETWSRFGDWMGALSLLRAVPTQRTYSIGTFAEGVAGWLADEEDLFDALRDFSHLESSGARPVAEVLRVLTQQTGAAATLQ